MADPLPEGVDPRTVLIDVMLENGKYRLIYHMDAKRPQAFRYGVPHQPTQDRMTAGSFRALATRVAGSFRALATRVAGSFRALATRVAGSFRALATRVAELEGTLDDRASALYKFEAAFDDARKLTGTDFHRVMAALPSIFGTTTPRGVTCNPDITVPDILLATAIIRRGIQTHGA
jgi:hypothetical protein